MVQSSDNFPRQGISRIGLVVVLAIIAILGALALQGVQKTREAAARTQCVNNLKQIILSVHNFESTFNRLPPLYGGSVSAGQYQASAKFPLVWGSTHVFILPYVESSATYGSMRTGGTPPNYLPSLSRDTVYPTYICPADPSMPVAAERGGTSYASNAQVFAPLRDETTSGSGEMFGMTDPNYCDRGTSLAGIKDGTSNTIGFMHSYGLCGSQEKGTFWLYTTGLQQPPENTQTFQPWARATYIGQKGMILAGTRPFQDQPSPFDRPYDAASGSGCDPILPASPHRNAMIVGVMDASVRSVAPNIGSDIWNKACLPNDGSEHPGAGWDN